MITPNSNAKTSGAGTRCENPSAARKTHSPACEQRRHQPVQSPVVRMAGAEPGEQHRLDRGEHQDARQIPQPERGQDTRHEQAHQHRR